MSARTNLAFSPTPLHIIHRAQPNPTTLIPLSRQLRIPAIGGHDIVQWDNILYLEAQSNYTYIYTRSNGIFCYSKSLKQVLTQISTPSFQRIHQSYYINTMHIKKILDQNQHITCIMNNDVMVPVSRRRKKEFKNWLKNQTIPTQIFKN